MVLQDHIIVGGGIIGLATAWTILRRHPGASVLLLEKEAAVAAHQSSHNSGVAHARRLLCAGQPQVQILS